jgi:hypothetical protein
MEMLIIYPKTEEQLTAVKAILKALKIDFKSDRSPYNPEFVEKILQGREDIKNGKGIRIAMEMRAIYRNCTERKITTIAMGLKPIAMKKAAFM